MIRIPVPVFAAVLLISGAAIAQDQQAPERLDNIWNGKAHALPPDQTRAEEKAAGIAPSPTRQRDETEEVERLERQLLEGAHEGPGAAGPGNQ